MIDRITVALQVVQRQGGGTRRGQTGETRVRGPVPDCIDNALRLDSENARVGSSYPDSPHLVGWGIYYSDAQFGKHQRTSTAECRRRCTFLKIGGAGDIQSSDSGEHGSSGSNGSGCVFLQQNQEPPGRAGGLIPCVSSIAGLGCSPVS